MRAFASGEVSTLLAPWVLLLLPRALAAMLSTTFGHSSMQGLPAHATGLLSSMYFSYSGFICVRGALPMWLALSAAGGTADNL